MTALSRIDQQQQKPVVDRWKIVLKGRIQMVGKKVNRETLAAMIFCVGCVLSGCQSEVSSPQTAETGRTAESAEPAHDHPDHGPHGGDLIELGDGDYHAEVVHGDASLTFWILDGSAADGVAVTADTAVINGSYAAEKQQFPLTAQPQDGDPEGTASCFVSDDATLLEWLEQPLARLRLSVNIGDTPWGGAIVHDHDHDHDH